MRTAVTLACLQAFYLIPMSYAMRALSSTSSCDRNEDCRNGGVCKFHADTGVSMCECLERYFGPTCTRYCPLQCQNEGICRFKGDDIGFQHLHGQDMTADHYECKCRGDFTGKFCEAPFESCPDGSQCLNGGECTEVNGNSSSYKCTCPFGLDGDRCEGSEETRTYTKGPVTREPVSGGSIAGIIVALVAVAVVAVIIARRHRRKAHEQVLAKGDDLMMMGRYSDNVDQDNEDDNVSGIEATTML